LISLTSSIRRLACHWSNRKRGSWSELRYFGILETEVDSKLPRLVTARFRDYRKTALTTCIAALLSLLIPTWRASQQVITIGSKRLPWWNILTFVLAYLFTPILPLFFFALYRNETTLRFSKRLRQLSLAAALVLGAIVAVDLVEWIGSLGATSVLVGARAPRASSDVSVLLSEFSNLACILLLIAFFRQASDVSYTEVQVSRVFRFVTKLAVIVGALVVTFALVQLVLTPYSYLQLRNYGCRSTEGLRRYRVCWQKQSVRY
jgi:hypothetical protein